jgi:hypothetical protein
MEGGKIMDKRTILELRDYILNKVIDFSEYYKNDNICETSFLDWNARDVIGHINSWIKFSEDKLESIKLKKSFEDISHVDIEQFNKTNYEKNKNKSLENIVNETKTALDRYKNIVDLFNEEELSSSEFPTGFSFELWKYMAIDLGVHPIMHMLYQYLKKKDYNNFIDEIEESKKYFMEFSNSNIKEYDFRDLFENKEKMEKRFKELKEKIKNKNIDLIEKIIKINMD